MWYRTFTVVVCVCVRVFGSVRVSSRIQTSEDVSNNAGSNTHIIYPRTGRLFHSDFVRDNEIFRSLERTNFMRRGPFAKVITLKRPKRDVEESLLKKHVYVASGRIPTVDMKKGVLIQEKETPQKAVLLKIIAAPKIARKERTKREAEDKGMIREKNISIRSDKQAEILPVEKPQPTNTMEEQVSEDGLTKNTEQEVDEDSNPIVKNNDTDKTLFVHDSIKTDQTAQTSGLPEVDGGLVGGMRKAVVDDSLELYPVYRGVQYNYPSIITERRLVYSPQLRVEMDLPVVSDYLPSTDTNSTEELEEQGRSRRPLKKLAFPLLLALKLKTAIMMPLILGLISLIAFKGLWSGLTALGIAAALGLKALVAGSTKVLVQPPPPPPPHFHHFPPHEITEYWSRRGDEYNDYRPNNWT